jgi:hypothetical protein
MDASVADQIEFVGVDVEIDSEAPARIPDVGENGLFRCRAKNV